MEIHEVHHKLDKQRASDYQINEIIPFAYPFRRIRINATVHKSPEQSIQQIYSVMLRAILEGYKHEEELIKFLGLQKEDFILRELYFLRERGYIDLISGVWQVTELGKEFVEDNSILKILEEEEFEFLLDAIKNEVVVKDFRLHSDREINNKLQPEIEFKHKSPKLLEGQNEQLSDTILRRVLSGNTAVLI